MPSAAADKNWGSAEGGSEISSQSIGLRVSRLEDLQDERVPMRDLIAS